MKRERDAGGMGGWLVGVDAGGTNSRALAVDPASGERRQARGPGANWTVHGAATCRERLETVVSEALPAGAEPAALCVGVAGYYPPDHQREAEEWLGARWQPVPGSPRPRAQIVPDVVNAWAGAFAGEPGVVVISGTGSIVYGRNAGGREARAGGWGPLFGDEGSAYAVAVACLRDLARIVDRAAVHDSYLAESTLPRRFMARWPELGGELRTWLRGIYRCGWGREQVAELASEVVAAAEAGDVHAAVRLEWAAGELADRAAAVERQLGQRGLPLALTGGLAGGSAILRESVASHLKHWESSLRPEAPRVTPLEGALLLAAELAGGEALRREVAGRLGRLE